MSAVDRQYRLATGVFQRSRDRTITDGKMPERLCPHCGEQVVKVIRYGQLSYECLRPCGNWGPWDEAHKKPTPSDAAAVGSQTSGEVKP